MQFSMHNISFLLGDIMLFVILQISGITLDVNLRLQLAGLGGAMLAVRTLDRKINVQDWIKVSFSGLVLSNFSGFAFCEWQDIPLTSFKAAFIVFFFGIFSDIILRMLAVSGKTFVRRSDEITNAFIDFFKNFFSSKPKT